MNKKAQGLSLNTVVIAAIVLIVLVVLIGIFTGSLGQFVKDFLGISQKSCPDANQKAECDYVMEKEIYGPFEPELKEEKCCQPITNCEDLRGECLATGACANKPGGAKANRLGPGDEWCKEKSSTTPECCRR